MIGGTLEYVMTSLPHLVFQKTQENENRVLGLLQKYHGSSSEKLDPVEILNHEAQKFLPVSRYHLFQRIKLNEIHEAEFRNKGSNVLTGFSEHMFQLKKEIKAWRTSHNGDKPNVTIAALDNIIGEGSPLEKEIKIMQHQWKKLEELSVGHFADFEALIAYKIKLMILLRWWEFDTKRGFSKFIQLTSNN